jgi:hypothetical protein
VREHAAVILSDVTAVGDKWPFSPLVGYVTTVSVLQQYIIFDAR